MVWYPGRLLVEVYDTYSGSKVGVVIKSASEEDDTFFPDDKVWFDPQGAIPSGLGGVNDNPQWVVPTKNVIAMLTDAEFLKMLHHNEVARMELRQEPVRQ